MKETWRKQMQQKMADYEKPAPEVSWEQIEQAVAANKRKAKLVPLWTRRIAAAAVILLSVGAGYKAFFADKTNATEQSPPLASQTPVSPKEVVSPKEIVAPQTPEQKLLGQTAVTPVTIADSQKQEENVTEQKENLIVKNVDTAEQKQSQTEQKADSQQTEKVTTNPAHQPKPFDTQQQNFNDLDFRKKSGYRNLSPTGNRLTAKLYLSNSMADKGTDTAVDFPTDPSATGPIGPPGDDEEPPKIYDNIYHRQPVRFGLSFNYRFANRWSIESGVVYTRLSSNYTYQPFDFFFVKAEQRLTYLGVPLKVNHLLWTKRHFNLYASLGGMAEKMLKGRRTYDLHFDQPTVEESITIRPLQFSLNAAIGAEYRLTDLFSIYAEPELNYYFKDSSIEVPTFYQDKALNFSISVGLRMNFNGTSK